MDNKIKLIMYDSYLVWFKVPQWSHVRRSLLASNRSMIGFNCVPRSVQWNHSSYTILLQSGFEQYHRNASNTHTQLVNNRCSLPFRLSCDLPRWWESLTRSTTIPMVSAYRTGLWGVLPIFATLVIIILWTAQSAILPGNKNISPSPTFISRNSPSSTTLSVMLPLIW